MLRNVLIVDSDQNVLQVLQRRFAVYSETFSLITVSGSVEAADILEKQYISLLVLDLRTTDPEGVKLYTLICEKYSDLPVIIMTGSRSPDILKYSKAPGVVAFLAKPFQVDELGKAVQRILQKEADGGIMHGVSPSVFLQLMEMEGKSCTIRALDPKSGQGGILYFKDGFLLDGRVGPFVGIDAAYRLFSWENVTIIIQNSCPDRPNVINSELQPIIMQAVSMKDESEAAPEEFDEEYEDDDEEQMNIFGIAGGDPGSPSEELEARDTASLGDIDVPSGFFDAEDEERIPAAEEIIDRNLQSVSAIVEESFPEKETVLDIHEDPSATGIVAFFEELGSAFQLGGFEAGYLPGAADGVGRVILSGEQPICLNTASDCPHHGLVRRLLEG